MEIIAATLAVSLPAVAQEKLKKLEQQASDIISQMTLEEKFSQLMNETPGIARLGIQLIAALGIADGLLVVRQSEADHRQEVQAVGLHVGPLA